MKHVVIIIFLLLILGISFLLVFALPKNKSETTNTLIDTTTKRDKKIELGVWTEGLYDAREQTLQPEKLLEFEQLTQKKYSIAHYYRGWEALVDPALPEELGALHSNGWKPMLNVNPYFFSKCPAIDTPLYKAIADGQCDEFLKSASQNLNKVKQPFYLVFAWEMNNKDLEWSVPYTGSKSGDFRAAWRRIHSILSPQNSKINWVFCPNIPDIPEFPYEDIYPGDDYIDWICLDGYNWGETQSWSDWSSFSGVFGSAYTKITTIAPTKPLMIGEVNTTNIGGDKADWYRDMFELQLPHNFPKIQAVVIFNEDKTKNEKVNWRVDINKESLEAFKSGVKKDIYK